jgi:hypothetical protein
MSQALCHFIGLIFPGLVRLFSIRGARQSLPDRQSLPVRLRSGAPLSGEKSRQSAAGKLVRGLLRKHPQTLSEFSFGLFGARNFHPERRVGARAAWQGT